MSAAFAERVAGLPRLGVGISTEFGARHAGLDPLALRRARPELIGFLEIGADLERGIDEDALAWAASGWPTTYHFLDANLEERESLSAEWLDATREQASSVAAAWLCGDAGLWHIGPRERGHGVLMPPILCAESALEMAENVRRMREATGFEVLPENPPAHLYLGDLHLLDYFARVADGADCGLLLDVAHLAIYPRATGRAPTDGLPVERVVGIHMAANFRRRAAEGAESSRARLRVRAEPRGRGHLELRTPARSLLMDHRRVQRALFRMQLDPGFAARLYAGDPQASADLGTEKRNLLRSAAPVALCADRDGKRRAQFLANVSSEFALSRAAGLGVGGFPSSDEFHGALLSDQSLALALARYAIRCTREKPRALRALIALESALAHARRALRPGRAPHPGEVALAPWVSLEPLPAGTLTLASRLRAALDTGAELPALALARAPDETLIVRASPETTPFRLRAAEVESGSPALIALLREAREPRTRVELASALAIERAELEPVVDELVADRVLVSA